MKKHEVKQHSDFLVNGLWVLNRRCHDFKITKYHKGKPALEMSTKSQVPTMVDIKFLLWFMRRSQHNNNSVKIYFTKSEVLKECSLKTSGINTERLEDSIDRWKAVIVRLFDFEGFKRLTCSPIDEHGPIKGRYRYYLKLNSKFKRFVENETHLCKTVNFEEYVKIDKGEALRLYEVLTARMSYKRTIFVINLRNLFELMGFSCHYSNSRFKKKIKDAVVELNKRTSLKLSIDIEKTKDGKDEKFIFESKYFVDKAKAKLKQSDGLKRLHYKQKAKIQEKAKQEQKREVQRRRREDFYRNR